MAVPLYMDVHVPWAITDQLRRRGIDVLTAQEDESTESTDEQLLERALHLGRLLFTQDIRFKSRAEGWQRDGRLFAGLVFSYQLRGSIGQHVEDLEIIAKLSEPADWLNQVEHVHFR